MNVFRSSRFITAALLVSAAVACGKKDAPAANDIPVPAPTTAPAAIKVSDIETGKALSTDKSIMNGLDSFGVRDTIYVAVKTEGSSAGAKLTAKWTYNDAQVVSETSETIAPNGNAITEFHIAKPSAWPKGKYRVDISLDGVQSGSKEFVIK